MTGAILHIGAMGLLVSVVAPAIVLATRHRVAWHRVPAPPAVALPLFVVLHAVVTIVPEQWHLPVSWDALLHVVLVVGAVWFWLPIVGNERTSPAVRSLYLFMAGPSLDLAAVYLIIKGHSAGGLAMIVAMLPIGFAAMAVTWRWITEEERHAW